MSQPKLSHLAETLSGSEIVKLGNAISERIRQGEKIYNFTIGDFDPSIFPIPNELESLIIESYREHNTNYPSAEGVIDLRKSVASFIHEREGLVYSAEEIQIAAGGRPLIYSLFKAIVDKGDKVIYGVPSWNNNHYAHLTDAVHCVINCSEANNFMPTVDEIKSHIKGAALICICTPQNPTGTTLNKQSLEAICNLIIEENNQRKPEQKKLYLMFDQMYWTLTFGDTVHYNPVQINPEMRQYTIFVDGISKVFAATGVRVGWALGPAPIIAKMKAILSHVGAWAPMAEQKAVAKYLLKKDAIDEYLLSFKSAIATRLNKIYQGFESLKQKGYAVNVISPQAAIYLTIQINITGKTTADGTVLAKQSDVTSYLLNEAKLAIVPFSAFGGQPDSAWYRLSVGTCKVEEIDEMIGKLELALSKLK